MVVEKALPSWEAVAQDPSIDAVSIVVGNALHRPIAEALVAAGKHVLCEKPLAGSMEDGRAMVELERTADVVTAVGYTFRRSPPIAAIRDHVRNGELGELRARVQLARLRRRDRPRRRGQPPARSRG